MGFLKKLIDKINQECFFVVDINTLYEELNNDLKITLDENLEAGENINIYFHGEKHHIQIWNYAASDFKDEIEKGLIIYFDDIEYKSIDELFENAIISGVRLNEIKEFFKIELIDGIISPFLKEYKDKHPELHIEDYE